MVSRPDPTATRKLEAQALELVPLVLVPPAANASPEAHLSSRLRNEDKDRKAEGMKFSPAPTQRKEIKQPPQEANEEVKQDPGVATNGADKEEEKTDKRPGKRLKKQSGGSIPTKLVETEKKSRKTPKRALVNQVTTDDKGWFIVRPGQAIKNGGMHYRIQTRLGQGGCGTVVKCKAFVSGGTTKTVALKISRTDSQDREMANREYELLQYLKVADPRGIHHCVRANGLFPLGSHVAIVFECLGSSLADFLMENSFESFPTRHVQDIARQLLDAVAFIHSEGIVHVDLKPDNILLTEGDTCRVRLPTSGKVIDFGGAFFQAEGYTQVISTLPYQAPEVVLRMDLSFPCDLFSTGLILLELYRGLLVFHPRKGERVGHLRQMEAVIGAIPASLIREKNPTFFKVTDELDWPNANTTEDDEIAVAQLEPLQDLMWSEDESDSDFLQLLEGLLEWDPEKRVTADEALKSPYLLPTGEPKSKNRSVVDLSGT